MVRLQQQQTAADRVKPVSCLVQPLQPVQLLMLLQLEEQREFL